MAQKKLLSPTSPEYIGATQPLIQRSQYLAEALGSLNEGNQDVRGGLGEVAARIGSAYLLNRGLKKNNQALASAVAGQRKAKTDAAAATLASLLGPQVSPVSTPQAAPKPPQAPVSTPSFAPASNNTTPAPSHPLTKQPLSVRNNNPGNLRWDGKSQWKGMTGVDPRGFVQFLTPELGARAAGINLGNQQKLHGINTLSGLISKYAPPSDNNDTAAYIRTVAQKTGLDPNAPIDLQDPAIQAKVLPVMFNVESGGTPARFQAPQPQAMAQPSPQQPVAAPEPVSPAAGASALQAAPVAGSFAHAPIDPQEIAFARRLLQSQDPAEQEQGYAMVQDLQKRAMTPVKYEVGTVNGVPVWNNPYQPGQTQTGAIPQGAMNQTVQAQELGIAAPQGTTFSRSPTGQLQQVYAPPAGYESTPQGQRPVQGGSADPRSGLNLVAGEGKLRDDYTKDISEYVGARTGYQKVVNAIKNNSGAGDMALVFGYMKTLDPTSTVREGEAASVQNTANVPDRIRNLYNQLLSPNAERMQPAQRNELAKAAYGQLQAYQSRADQVTSRYGELAQSYGYDPSRIVQQFEKLEEPQLVSQGPKGAQRGQDGNWYAPDPSRKGSFPRVQQGTDPESGKPIWYIPRSDGKFEILD